jgi:plastocyanin
LLFYLLCALSDYAGKFAPCILDCLECTGNTCLYDYRLFLIPSVGSRSATGLSRSRYHIGQNFAFNPPSMTVKTGTTVTWMNNDGTPHTIVTDNGSTASFSSDPLATGAVYTFTFTQPGTYTYHCSIHPSMKGEIIVQ